MRRAIRHESGRISLIDSHSNNIKLQIYDSSGKEDKAREEIPVVGVSDGEFRDMIGRPRDFPFDEFKKRSKKNK